MRARLVALGAAAPAAPAGPGGLAPAAGPSRSVDPSSGASDRPRSSPITNATPPAAGQNGAARPREGRRTETWLPAAPASAATARSIVREAGAEAGLDGDGCWDLMLATSEAVANAVQHGQAWPNHCIMLTTEPCPRGLRVEVWDCGTFDDDLEPTPLESTSGRGIPIIAAVVDRLEVQNGNGRTLVRFERHAPTD